MFDLFGESHILINPPVDAALAGVVWEDSLSGPHLRGGKCEISVHEHILIGLEEH